MALLLGAPGRREPPSLLNIFQEINRTCPTPRSGRTRRVPAGCHPRLPRRLGSPGRAAAQCGTNGGAWSRGSHQGRGWEQFTDRSSRSEREGDRLVFMLWGSYAQKKGAIVDRSRHCVLSSPHPSPLSAHRGFFGCRHFSKANRYLDERPGADRLVCRRVACFRTRRLLAPERRRISSNAASRRLIR